MKWKLLPGNVEFPVLPHGGDVQGPVTQPGANVVTVIASFAAFAFPIVHKVIPQQMLLSKSNQGYSFSHFND